MSPIRKSLDAFVGDVKDLVARGLGTVRIGLRTEFIGNLEPDETDYADEVVPDVEYVESDGLTFEGLFSDVVGRAVDPGWIQFAPLIHEMLFEEAAGPLTTRQILMKSASAMADYPEILAPKLNVTTGVEGRPVMFRDPAVLTMLWLAFTCRPSRHVLALLGAFFAEFDKEFGADGDDRSLKAFMDACPR